MAVEDDEDGPSSPHHVDNGIGFGIDDDVGNNVDRNYFAPRTEHDDDNDDDDADDDEEEDEDEFADFITSKWQDGVETGLTVIWPRPMGKQNKGMLPSHIVPSSPSTLSLQSQPTYCLHLSTQLQEDAIAPLFDGTQWAGTRVWKAAILGLEYILNEYGSRVDDNMSDDDSTIKDKSSKSSLLELGCGLGVPGMLWYMTQQRVWSERQKQQDQQVQRQQQPNDGHKRLLSSSSSSSPFRPLPRVTLTDQPSLLPQLESNLVTNFGHDYKMKHNIQAKTLSWSEQGILDLLKEEEEKDDEEDDDDNIDDDDDQHRPPRYDICLNCDCIYEPLYGVEARRALTEVLKTMAIYSPKTILVTSVERRNGDGVGTLLHDLAQSGVVETDHANRIPCMYRNDDDPHHVIEIYVTKGIDNN